MKPQHFAYLAVAAAGSLAAALAVYSTQYPSSTPADAGALMLPDLRAQADKIARIEIKQGDRTSVLARSGDKWVLDDRGGFPASADKIRKLLGSLSVARLVEPKTKNPERYGILELGEPGTKGSNSRLLRLLDDKGQVLSEVIAGKTRQNALGSGKSGTYVRRPNAAQTWLVNGEFAGGTALKDWTKARLFETATEKIKTTRVEPAGSSAYEINRDSDGTHKLAIIPDGKKLKFLNVLDNVLEAISFVDFEDVRKAGSGSEEILGSASFETDSGLKVTYKIRGDKEEAWTTLTATGDGEGKKAADEIMARAEGWEFKIVSGKAKTILKRYDDLLEDSSS
jgi:Domain of unknown function (DUF4340)